ncbi:MAG: hypothetical protein M9921_10710 [Fimbriimonadaceae bacterium]|nr:hypothetical protein [Fimbriimonadaceae bacterium]
MFRVHFNRVVWFAVLGLGAGIGATFVLPKVYQAQTQLLVDDGKATELKDYSAEVANILGGGFASGIETEQSILQSKQMFGLALSSLASKRNDPGLYEHLEDLYQMYAVLVDRGSRAVIIQVKANDPETATQLADAVADAYNEKRRISAQQAKNEAELYLDKKVEEARAELDTAEEALASYKEKYNITDVTTAETQAATYLATLQEQRDQAKAQLAAVESEIRSQLAQLQVLPKTVEDTISQVRTPLVTALEAQRAQLQADRLTALRTYTPESRKVQDLDALIEETQKKILEEKSSEWTKQTRTFRPDPVRLELENALALSRVQQQSLYSKVASADRLYSEQESLISALPGRSLEFVRLSRDASILDGRYRQLKQNIELLKNKTERTMGVAQVLFAAEADPEPVAPEPIKLGLVGLIGGLCFGLLTSFLIESMRLPVRSSGQLAELTGLPVLAAVPALSRRKAKRLLRTLPRPDCRPNESFRFMAFAQMARGEEMPKLVMFTGVGGDVGCSSSAAQFALAASRTGLRVLLVDCDLRNPTLTDLFHARERSGVSDMLSRTLLPSDATSLEIPTQHENLFLIPAGSDGKGGLGDYPTSHVIGIIEGLREKADLVVLDTPPCDVLADASRLTPYVDHVSLVVSAATTGFRAVPVAYEILQRSGAKEIQLVLTHASPRDEPFSQRTRAQAA